MTVDVAGIPVEFFAIGGGLFSAIVAAAGLLRRGRRGARLDDEAAAMDGAAAALPGFAPQAAVVGHDGAAALVGGGGGGNGARLALVRANGNRLVAREIDWGAVRATPAGIVVETGGKGGRVPIVGVDALDVRRLAPAASPEAIAIAEGLAPPPDISEVVRL
ncbi:hypothetical protein [uncultured Sphingomonas sp.]|uniref:hypothetical protein n=1 Tax=uncultured Sphingomonas sp. TaxID=158754 RepID=UPI0035C9E1E8